MFLQPGTGVKHVRNIEIITLFGNLQSLCFQCSQACFCVERGQCLQCKNRPSDDRCDRCHKRGNKVDLNIIFYILSH